MNEKTHWLQSPNKNYLGHWDLPEGRDTILTIKSAQWEEVKNPITNTSEAKRVVRWEEKGVKPWICNQTNAQSIINATGIKYMEESGGKKIQLFIDNIQDKRTKDFIDCIRVRNKNTLTERQQMTPEHKKWEELKEKVSEGVTLEMVRKHYDISDENWEKLCG